VRVAGTASANDTTTPKTATVTCASGQKALGGGGIITNNGTGTVSLTTSYPSADDTWSVTGDRQSGSGNWTLQAWAVCATVS
jgi:hypothetical protein